MDFQPKYSSDGPPGVGHSACAEAKIGGTPPTYPLEALLGAGSAKSVCKILMSKSLEVKILRTENLGRDDSRIAYRPGLDHDRASSMGGARSDVTRGLWISLPHRRISYLTRRRHAHLPKIAEGGASSVTVVPAKEGQPPSIKIAVPRIPMEPIRHNLTERILTLQMYREELDQLLSFFQRACAKVTISDKHNRYDSLDDMKAYVGIEIGDIDIRGENPGVHFLMNQSEVVKGSPSTLVYYYNELRTEEISDEADNLFYKVRDFLMQHRPPRFRRALLILAIVAAGACIVFGVLDRELLRANFISLRLLVCLLVAAGFLVASTQSGNHLRLEKKANLPSFWARNKEAFATHAATSAISVFVGWLLGHFLK